MRKTDGIIHVYVRADFGEEGGYLSDMYTFERFWAFQERLSWVAEDDHWSKPGLSVYHTYFPQSITLLASAPLHTQDTEIGLGALVWQPQPSFSISNRSCLMAEKSRQNAGRIARQKMKTGCERHGERESERRREDRATKLGRTRKTIRCYQSEQ